MKGKESEYKRVSCDLYDQYEIVAMRKEEVELEYLDEETGSLITELLIIKTLQTENKEEFLFTSSGKKIRLDQIRGMKRK